MEFVQRIITSDLSLNMESIVNNLQLQIVLSSWLIHRTVYPKNSITVVLGAKSVPCCIVRRKLLERFANQFSIKKKKNNDNNKFARNYLSHTKVYMICASCN